MNSNVPVAMIGLLNSHARAERSEGLREAIYAYKLLAAMVLVREGAATRRYVKWTGKCHACTDGWFTHWDWDDHHKVPCRTCGGKGVKTLRFTETTWQDNLGAEIWHHPWEGRTSPGRDIAAVGGALTHDAQWNELIDGVPIAWAEAGEWGPHRPGVALELGALVPLLNIIEGWVERYIPANQSERFKVEHARHYLSQRRYRRVYGAPSHSYHLDLGTAPGGCFVCGETERAGLYGQMSPLLHWSLPVCHRHWAGPEKAAFPKEPPPAALITPDIQSWLDRHERVLEVA